MSVQESHREHRRRTLRGPVMIFGTVMTFVYLGLGIALLVDRAFFSDIPIEFRNIFAVLLIVYGLYRGWRVYWDYYRG
ncbi:MAG: hypothetical protein RMJ33_04610 [Saprospiraceae bacterium]|nr:hypothetical protein [Saprospiraceae bacterium]MDW8229100.1 hypothetical protein [Saprospiraceae bacterium]